MNNRLFRVITRLALASIVLLALSACGSIVRKEAPTIAHIHIGHAITGWPAAPNKQGLLVAAELASLAAATNSQLMLKAARGGDMERAKKYLTETANAVDPSFLSKSKTNEYGLRKAAAEAITHLRLASEVEDASANVQRTVTTTRIKAEDIIDRSDELLAYLDAGFKASDVEEMEIIAEEIVRTLNSIAGGSDIPDNYGLYDFREDIEKMVEREDPAYVTVDSFYLFNLVKLPDGKYGFSSRSSRGSAGAGY